MLKFQFITNKYTFLMYFNKKTEITFLISHKKYFTHLNLNRNTGSNKFNKIINIFFFSCEANLAPFITKVLFKLDKWFINVHRNDQLQQNISSLLF